jgi:1-phosphatidylinositol phosphodiesterase
MTADSKESNEGENVSTNTTVSWSNNWMSAIEDDTNIAAISIPGTHESCARYQLAFTAQCQWFSPIQQLQRGIRFLDVRCNYETGHEAGLKQHIYFPNYHGGSNQYTLFEEIQAQCVAFLDANPTEFILMNVQMNDEADPLKFGEKFLELIAPYRGYWYLDDGLKTVNGKQVPNLPAIKDVRKRIVLIRAGNSGLHKGWWPPAQATQGGLSWAGFYIDGETSETIFQTQNRWHKVADEDKRKMVEEYMTNAHGYAAAGQITLNFASYDTHKTPGENAQRMNVWLQGDLKNKLFKAPLGVIAVDFTGNTGDAGDSLENLIIQGQAHQKANYSYGGIPEWLLKISS